MGNGSKRQLGESSRDYWSQHKLIFNKIKFRQQWLQFRSAWIFLVTASWATCPGLRRRPPTSPSRWSSCSSSPTPPSWSSSSCDRGSSQSLGKFLLSCSSLFCKSYFHCEGVPSPGVRFSMLSPESRLWLTPVWIPTFFSFSTPTTERLHTSPATAASSDRIGTKGEENLFLRIAVGPTGKWY